jgi:hypothetical protein
MAGAGCVSCERRCTWLLIIDSSQAITDASRPMLTKPTDKQAETARYRVGHGCHKLFRGSAAHQRRDQFPMSGAIRRRNGGGISNRPRICGCRNMGCIR